MSRSFADYTAEQERAERVRKTAKEEAQASSTGQCLPIPLANLTLDVGPREWVYGQSLVRGMLSVLGGPGGVGKTKYALKVALSIAVGRSLIGDPGDRQHYIHQPRSAVWYVTLEDPTEELQRNLKAEFLTAAIRPGEIANRFFVASGRDTPLLVANMQDGVISRLSIDYIVNSIKATNISLMIVDPFANSFDGGEGSESGSDAMKIILDQWRKIAHQANCAVWLLHHFRKGGLAGDAEAFRGSSVIQNAARVMETLTMMTKEDAEALGVQVSERKSYVRLENAKVNLSIAGEGQWLKFRSVALGNATPAYPDGDVIGVVERWKPHVVAMTWDKIERALDTIDAGTDGGTEFYSSAKQANRWAGSVIMSHGVSLERAVALLGGWIDAGVLRKSRYTSPGTRKSVERLSVDFDGKMKLQKAMEGGI